jgi:hypothetical protein
LAAALIRRIPILNDPPEERRVAMMQRLPNLSNYLATDVSEWAEQMGTVRDHELWRDVGAESWDDYCVRIVGKPLDWCSWIIGGYEELNSKSDGMPVPEAEALEAGKRVAAVMAAAPTLTGHGGARTSAASNAVEQGRDTTLKGGNRDNRYLAARIKRDHPEIAAAAERGEYPSMRKAAIAAGIVKESSTFGKLTKLWGRADDDTRSRFLALVSHQSGNEQ